MKSFPRILSPNQHKGFILLFTIVVISVTVGLSVSLLISANRQAQLGSTQSETQAAFYAADTGVDCGLAFVYPDTPPQFTCVGAVRTDKSIDTSKKNIFYFDFRNVGPVSSWGNLDWDSPDQGGASSACGVVVVTKDASWGTGPGQSGILVESYGYSICAPDATGLLVPVTNDPNQIERKVLVRIPVLTV